MDDYNDDDYGDESGEEINSAPNPAEENISSAVSINQRYTSRGNRLQQELNSFRSRNTDAELVSKIRATETYRNLPNDSEKRKYLSNKLSSAIEYREKHIEKMSGVMQSIEERRITETTNSLMGYVKEDIGKSRIHEERNTLASQALGSAYARQMSPVQLQQNFIETQRALERAKKAYISTVNEYAASGDPLAAIPGVTGISKDIRSLEKDIAAFHHANIIQKDLGKDYRSMEIRSQKMLENIMAEYGDFRDPKVIANELQKKKSAFLENRVQIASIEQQTREKSLRIADISNKERQGIDLTEEEAREKETLIAENEKLTESLQNLISTTHELTNDITGLNDEQRRAKAAGGGDIMGKIMPALKVLETVATISKNITGIVETSQIQKPLLDMQNTKINADQNNRVYSNFEAAIKGDQQAKIMLSSQKEMVDIRNNLESIRKNTIAASAATDITLGAAKVGGETAAAIYSGGASLAVTHGGLAASGASDISSGVNSLILRKQLATQTGLNAYDMAYSTIQSLSTLDAKTLQKVNDYGTSIGAVTQGAGRKAGLFGEQALNLDFIKQLAQQGVNTDEIPGLMEMGIRGAGNMFSMSDLSKAARTQNAGLGDKTDFFRRQATLAGVSGDKDLVDKISRAIMSGSKEGITAGMAKETDTLVQMVSNFSARNIGTGVDLGDQYASMLLNGLKEINPYTLSQSATGLESMQNRINDKSMDYGKMIAGTEVIAKTGNPMFAAFMQNASTGMLEKLQDIASRGGSLTEKETQEFGTTGFLSTIQDLAKSGKLRDVVSSQIAGNAFNKMGVITGGDQNVLKALINTTPTADEQAAEDEYIRATGKTREQFRQGYTTLRQSFSVNGGNLDQFLRGSRAKPAKLDIDPMTGEVITKTNELDINVMGSDLDRRRALGNFSAGQLEYAQKSTGQSISRIQGAQAKEQVATSEVDQTTLIKAIKENNDALKSLDLKEAGTNFKTGTEQFKTAVDKLIKRLDVSEGQKVSAHNSYENAAGNWIAEKTGWGLFRGNQ